MIVNTPRLEKWVLLFRAEDGYTNKEQIARNFQAFWSSRDQKYEVLGTCLLGGNIIGAYNIRAGQEIKTSSIKYFERVEQDTICGSPHDLIRATTKSGHEYYFYSDEYHPIMGMMFGDIKHLGGIDQRKNYYVPESMRSTDLL